MKNSNVIDNKHPVGCWWANGIFIEMHFYRNSNVGSWQIRLVHKIPREHCCILWSSWINMRIKSFVFKLYLVATKRLVLGLFVVLIVQKTINTHDEFKSVNKHKWYCLWCVKILNSCKMIFQHLSNELNFNHNESFNHVIFD